MELHKPLPNFLRNRLQQPLPGDDAHFLMLPFKRQAAVDVLRKKDTYRESAVCLLLFPENDKWNLLLMKRPEYNGTHSGQISFPGGKAEEEDATHQDTALRELWEEAGVPPDDVEVLGELTQVYIPPSGFLVSVFVGMVNETPEFVPDPREVAALISAPVDLFLSETTVKSTRMTFKKYNATIDTPYFDVFGHVVWGATSAMLSEFKVILQEFVQQQAETANLDPN